MSIEQIGAYSPDTVYGQLTMPFLDKPVHINAHTPLDEEGDVVLNRGSFYNNLTQGKVSVEEIRAMGSLELDDSLKVDIGIKVAKDFPPEPNVEVFQASAYTKGSGVVNEALKLGYTGMEALKFGNAYNSYRNAMVLGENPAQTLINTNFAVSK